MTFLEYMISTLKERMKSVLRVQVSRELTDQDIEYYKDHLSELIINAKHDLLMHFVEEADKHLKYDKGDGPYMSTIYKLDYVMIHRDEWENIMNAIKHLITEVKTKEETIDYYQKNER